MGLFKENQQSLKNKKKMYNNPSTSLVHVMNLFEERNPVPLGPLPIKANGAIVVHRPSLHQKQSHQDLLSLVESEELSLPSSLVTDTNEEEDEEEEEDEKLHLIQLLTKENHKLKHRLHTERQEKETLEQDLLYAQHQIKQLERINQRFEKMILLPRQPLPAIKTRRQSTNSISQRQLQVSSENKIQILLDEIDAMEREEFNQSLFYKLKCEKLTKKLLNSHKK